MRSVMDDPMVLESLLPYPKTLDPSVLSTRPKEMQDVMPEDGGHENDDIDASASGEMKVTEQVAEMEASPPALTHIPAHDDMSNHGDGAEGEAAQEEELALVMKPSEEGNVIEQPLEGVDGSSSSPTAGNDTGAQGNAEGQKKRKERGKNWTDDKETDSLLKVFLKKKSVGSRVDQGGSFWMAVAKEVPGRTEKECRGRMDSLKKSYSRVKKYCDEHGKEFKEVSEEMFNPKLSPWLTEDWYNQIRKDCAPKPKKRLKIDGAGSSSKSRGFAPCASPLGLQPAIMTDGMDQGEPTLAVTVQYARRQNTESAARRKKTCRFHAKRKETYWNCYVNHTKHRQWKPTRRIWEVKGDCELRDMYDGLTVIFKRETVVLEQNERPEQALHRGNWESKRTEVEGIHAQMQFGSYS